jgi:hypothetical protein
VSTPTRIDHLVPGSFVELEINEASVEQAMFVRIDGSGEHRHAVFCQILTTTTGAPRTYEWEAHRYNGHWAYGTSSQPLRLERVISEPISQVSA